MNTDSSAEHKGTILCVEDDKDVLRVLGIMLESHGYEALLARDGEEGLNMFRQHKRDLVAVVLDLKMPKMDGLAAAREIRKESPDIPLVALSAYFGASHNEEALARCEEAGFNAYTIKPFAIEPFLKTIEGFIRRKAPKNDKPQSET